MSRPWEGQGRRRTVPHRRDAPPRLRATASAPRPRRTGSWTPPAGPRRPPSYGGGPTGPIDYAPRSRPRGALPNQGRQSPSWRRRRAEDRQASSPRRGAGGSLAAVDARRGRQWYSDTQRHSVHGEGRQDRATGEQLSRDRRAGAGAGAGAARRGGGGGGSGGGSGRGSGGGSGRGSGGGSGGRAGSGGGISAREAGYRGLGRADRRGATMATAGRGHGATDARQAAPAHQEWGRSPLMATSRTPGRRHGDSSGRDRGGWRREADGGRRDSRHTSGARGPRDRSRKDAADEPRDRRREEGANGAHSDSTGESGEISTRRMRRPRHRQRRRSPSPTPDRRRGRDRDRDPDKAMQRTPRDSRSHERDRGSRGTKRPRSASRSPSPSPSLSPSPPATQTSSSDPESDVVEVVRASRAPPRLLDAVAALPRPVLADLPEPPLPPVRKAVPDVALVPDAPNDEEGAGPTANAGPDSATEKAGSAVVGEDEVVEISSGPDISSSNIDLPETRSDLEQFARSLKQLRERAQRLRRRKRDAAARTRARRRPTAASRPRSTRQRTRARKPRRSAQRPALRKRARTVDYTEHGSSSGEEGGDAGSDYDGRDRDAESSEPGAWALPRRATRARAARPIKSMAEPGSDVSMGSDGSDSDGVSGRRGSGRGAGAGASKPRGTTGTPTRTRGWVPEVVSDSDEAEVKASGSRSESDASDGSAAESSDEGSDSDSDSASDSDSDAVELAVSQVLGWRSLPRDKWVSECHLMNTRLVRNGSIFGGPGVGKKDAAPEERFLVKWRGLSHLHLSWETRADLMSLGDPSVKSRIRKFEEQWLSEPAPANAAVVNHLKLDESFSVVDRVLGHRRVQGGGSEYFVKWMSLPHENCTWETEADLASFKERIEEYHERARRAMPMNLGAPRRSVREFLKLAPPVKSRKKEMTLRDYQLEGVDWMTFNWVNKRNSILADEMGLGKTAQVYHGSIASRDVLEDWELYRHDGQGVEAMGIRKKDRKRSFDVLITTYEMVKRARKLLHGIRLKNPRSQLVQEFQQLKYQSLLLLTGTPLQNNLEELWTLLRFISPREFGDQAEFLREFGDIGNVESVTRLKEELKKYLLRRQKEDVETSIPPREETVVMVEMTMLQKRVYRALFEKNFRYLAAGVGRRYGPAVTNLFMQLRKCCNHPYLIKGVEHRVREGVEGGSDDVTPRSDMSEEAQDKRWQRYLLLGSGKMVLLDKLLPKLLKQKEKVLIFSQFSMVLDLIEDYLRMRRYLYERLDGSITGNRRQAAIDRFSRPGSPLFVFLLTTRAGGVGINLTAATSVIIFDCDWNPQNDIQAQTKTVTVYRLLMRNTYETHMFSTASRKLGLDQALMHGVAGKRSKTGRAGPTRDQLEKLLRYGAFNLMEESERKAASGAGGSGGGGASKGAATGTGSSTDAGAKNTDADGTSTGNAAGAGAGAGSGQATSAAGGDSAADAAPGGGGSAGPAPRRGDRSQSFLEASIEDILKGAKTVKISGGSGGMSSSFAKASFVADDAAEVDINDPDFWMKYDFGFSKDLAFTDPNVVQGPRRRKQVSYTDRSPWPTPEGKGKGKGKGKGHASRVRHEDAGASPTALLDDDLANDPTFEPEAEPDDDVYMPPAAEGGAALGEGLGAASKDGPSRQTDPRVLGQAARAVPRNVATAQSRTAALARDGATGVVTGQPRSTLSIAQPNGATGVVTGRPRSTLTIAQPAGPLSTLSIAQPAGATGVVTGRPLSTLSIAQPPLPPSGATAGQTVPFDLAEPWVYEEVKTLLSSMASLGYRRWSALARTKDLGHRSASQIAVMSLSIVGVLSFFEVGRVFRGNRRRMSLVEPFIPQFSATLKTLPRRLTDYKLSLGAAAGLGWLSAQAALLDLKELQLRPRHLQLWQPTRPHPDVCVDTAAVPETVLRVVHDNADQATELLKAFDDCMTICTIVRKAAISEKGVLGRGPVSTLNTTTGQHDAMLLFWAAAAGRLQCAQPMRQYLTLCRCYWCKQRPASSLADAFKIRSTSLESDVATLRLSHLCKCLRGEFPDATLLRSKLGGFGPDSSLAVLKAIMSAMIDMGACLQITPAFRVPSWALTAQHIRERIAVTNPLLSRITETPSFDEMLAAMTEALLPGSSVATSTKVPSELVVHCVATLCRDAAWVQKVWTPTVAKLVRAMTCLRFVVGGTRMHTVVRWLLYARKTLQNRTWSSLLDLILLHVRTLLEPRRPDRAMPFINLTRGWRGLRQCVLVHPRASVPPGEAIVHASARLRLQPELVIERLWQLKRRATAADVRNAVATIDMASTTQLLQQALESASRYLKVPRDVLAAQWGLRSSDAVARQPVGATAAGGGVEVVAPAGDGTSVSSAPAAAGRAADSRGVHGAERLAVSAGAGAGAGARAAAQSGKTVVRGRIVSSDSPLAKAPDDATRLSPPDRESAPPPADVDIIDLSGDLDGNPPASRYA